MASAVALSSISLLRLSFSACSVGIIVAALIPATREKLLDYGSRTNSERDASARVTGRRVGNGLIDAVARVRVPHSWFKHFYIASLFWSLFWALQVLFQGSVFKYIASNAGKTRPSSMTQDQAILVWLLMIVQGSRRLYECNVSKKQSTSTMWIGHYAVGLVFYTLINVAVWIEASPALLDLHFDAGDLMFKAPSLRTMLGMPIFSLASGAQHDFHTYLSSFKKYSLPQHPLFNICTSPHYLAECLIYLGLAVVAGPPGQLVNLTLLSALVFVVVNLGITAKRTHRSYEERFGANSVAGKAAMIPRVW